MNENAPTIPTHSASVPKSSGSQKRERVKNWQTAMTPEEYAATEAKARAAGLTNSSYGRVVLLGAAGPRAKRRPSVDAVALAQAVAQLNKVGSHLHQIAGVLETTAATATAQETDAALVETRTAITRILEMVGRKART